MKVLLVGVYFSVLICFSDGYLYGIFCCFSCFFDNMFNECDFRMMWFFVDVIGKIFEVKVMVEDVCDEIIECLKKVLDSGVFCIVY